MSFRRRREDRRQLPDGPPPHDTLPRWGEVGIHGIARPRDWDAVLTVEVALPGDTLGFVLLADATLVLEAGEGDPGSAAPLVRALSGAVEPPYRAEAVRKGERRWAVAAWTLIVVRLEGVPAEAQLELLQRGGERTLHVDGVPAADTIPALERLVEPRSGDYVLRAERIQGPHWEVEVDAL